MEIAFQQSLFGKTSLEQCYLETGWIILPYCERSRAPKFQFLLLEDGQMPEWCEGDAVISHGAFWTPSIGQAPGSPGVKESFLWQILQASVPEKYYLSPAQCSRILACAALAGCPPPQPIEQILLKQGGVYPSPNPFPACECAAVPNTETCRCFSEVLENGQIRFPLF